MLAWIGGSPLDLLPLSAAVQAVFKLGDARPTRLRVDLYRILGLLWQTASLPRRGLTRARVRALVGALHAVRRARGPL